MLVHQILQPNRLRAVSARLRFPARLLTQAFCTPVLEAYHSPPLGVEVDPQQWIGDRDRPMTARHLPPPWSVEDNGACFIVRDSNGQPLAYVYYEEEPGRRNAAGLLTRDEARRIAANIAKLPDLLSRPRT
jgi:hypothetical protein